MKSQRIKGLRSKLSPNEVIVVIIHAIILFGIKNSMNNDPMPRANAILRIILDMVKTNMSSIMNFNCLMIQYSCYRYP